MLGSAYGWRGQQRLWDMANRGHLEIAALSANTYKRMQALRRRYQDAPMDFADASLVAIAEELNTDLVFTLDRHFYAYRVHDRRAFRVLPDRTGR